jgi:hypothetical protein
MKNRFFADRFDADGKFYVFDDKQKGGEYAGPFDTPNEAQSESDRLQQEEDREQMLYRQDARP